MIEIEIPDGAATDELQRRFGARSVAAALVEAAAGTAPAISASRLYARASDPDAAPDPVVAQALRDNLSLRRLYRQMAEAQCWLKFPAVASADSGGVPRREVAGGTVWVEPSEAEPDQFYVIVEITPGTDAARLPRRLLLVDESETCHWFELPDGYDRVVQMPVDGASELLALLREPTTEILLK